MILSVIVSRGDLTDRHRPILDTIAPVFLSELILPVQLIIGSSLLGAELIRINIMGRMIIHLAGRRSAGSLRSGPDETMWRASLAPPAVMSPVSGAEQKYYRVLQRNYQYELCR